METNQIIREFRERAKQLYGKRLKNVILYSSWARGKATEGSDIDLAIVLDGDVVPGKEIDRYSFDNRDLVYIKSVNIY